MDKHQANIEEKIKDFQRYQSYFDGKTLEIQGLAIHCGWGLLPPNNRVTQYLGNFIADLDLSGSTILDVGCGTGVLGLIASRSAKFVMGTDISDEAIQCSVFNARMNHINNIQFLLGNGFAPVSGKMFSLITCNPPFYPAGKGHGALLPICINSKDNLIDSIILNAKSYLEPGGQLIFVTSSFTDNPGISRLLQSTGLLYSCKQVLQGACENDDDIFLWTVQSLDDSINGVICTGVGK